MEIDINLIYKKLSKKEKNIILDLIIDEFGINKSADNFTTIKEFIAKNHNIMTTRTRNVLKRLEDDFYTETLDPNDILRFRGGSKNVKNEFIKLRGY